jgi:DNA-binding HxlR family transcriptional regulator
LLQEHIRAIDERVPIRRSYADHGDACAAAHALDVVGDRWSVIVIRELMLGPKRFGELLADARGVTPTVLTGRLRELELAGIVEQITLPPPARVPAYRLTSWGLDFGPILQALGRWAQVSPARSPEGGLTPDAAILAMLTMAENVTPRTPLTFDIGLHDSRQPKVTMTWYRVQWGPGPLRADKHTNHLDPTDTIACDSGLWTELLFGEQAISPILASGEIVTRGSGRHAARAFITHFRRHTFRATAWGTRATAKSAETY